jgi:xylan 1,4-beta-xylosidase
MRLSALLLLALGPALAPAQEPVVIRVDASASLGPFRPIYSYFGYDEPNYTYMKYGPKLVGELAALSPAPVYIRTHHLLCTGDGTAALKWGSTNAYTEDASGHAVYDWTIVDRILDTYVHAKARPFVEIGFMPEALSTHPTPYTRNWPTPDDAQGWSYPPKDYDKWAELVRQWVLHSVKRYGQAEVEGWYWELWNEPDISYWKGTPEEYDKLYDATAAAVQKALPSARVGGPATTGPGNPKAAAFLKQFLEHCAATHTPLDFITYHAKGQPRVVEGHVRMGIDKQLTDVQRGLEIVNGFPRFAKLPIVLSESDPEGCAACSARTYPNNTYRNGTLYPVYTAASFSNIIKLADRHESNLEGALTWAFEFENQPYFDGFRSLATNGLDKPVLNVFRMFGLMRGARVKVESGGAVDLETMLESGVCQRPDIDALATRSGREIAVMAWNYHDDDLPGPPAAVRIDIDGIPSGARVESLRHYQIDQEHSNAYTAWKKMGSPQDPTPEQYASLERAGQLQLVGPPAQIRSKDGMVSVSFDLPRQGVSLIQLEWSVGR